MSLSGIIARADSLEQSCCFAQNRQLGPFFGARPESAPPLKEARTNWDTQDALEGLPQKSSPRRR
jgi:hypothetical protein